MMMMMMMVTTSTECRSGLSETTANNINETLESKTSNNKQWKNRANKMNGTGELLVEQQP